MATKLKKAKQKLGSWRDEFQAMKRERRANRKRIEELEREVEDLKRDIESYVEENTRLVNACTFHTVSIL